MATDPRTEALRAQLPSWLLIHINALGRRTRREQLRRVIVEIVTERGWSTPGEVAAILGMRAANLGARHLNPMVEAGILERRFPGSPRHPAQAYRVPAKPPSPDDP